ncbi:MAG: polyphosphate kinase 2 [Saprospiraceae bacterium]|nr:polyphosphate kinase 2 [Saprospiraceae bacterium]
MSKSRDKFCFNEDQIQMIRTRQDLLSILETNGFDLTKVNMILDYEKELTELQIELLKLQNWILKEKKRVVVVFEGRDAAGKGGTIRRFKRFLNPRSMRVVALNKPTSVEKGQWYFRRHVKNLPNMGELVFFDRSWYNRAVVEPVMGFCTEEEYQTFMRQVPEFEHMLFEDGVTIIKFWFSITRDEQDRRFRMRKKDPLKQWKLSPVDLKAQQHWDDFTHYKSEMFSRTHTSFAPWIIVNSNDKRIARLESIRYVLSRFEYDGKIKAGTNIYPDPNIVQRFHRSMLE